MPRDISEMCLNHKLSGVEGIYDQHTYYPERRQALETCVQFLMACEQSRADGSALAHARSLAASTLSRQEASSRGRAISVAVGCEPNFARHG